MGFRISDESRSHPKPKGGYEREKATGSRLTRIITDFYAEAYIYIQSAYKDTSSMHRK